MLGAELQQGAAEGGVVRRKARLRIPRTASVRPQTKRRRSKFSALNSQRRNGRNDEAVSRSSSVQPLLVARRRTTMDSRADDGRKYSGQDRAEVGPKVC
jgi:hypothetical protein